MLDLKWIPAFAGVTVISQANDEHYSSNLSIIPHVNSTKECAVNKAVQFVLLTPVLILLAHYLGMLPHEYAHSFMAWALGDKANPLALKYGGTGLENLLLLANMDENVNYSLILSAGHPYHVALIAFAGMGIANGLMYILSLCLLAMKYVQQRPVLYYFLFLFNLMNLGNFYDYVPVRTFGTHGDVANFILGSGISPWWIYSVGGYIVALLIYYFFTRTMVSAFHHLNLISTGLKASLMIISVFILFGFFGSSGLYRYGDVCYFISATSLLVIPGLIVALWPTREWVKRR